MIFTRVINLKTEWQTFFEITEEVRQIFADSGVKNGFVLVYSMHTTGAVKVAESEQLLLKDFENQLERTAPKTIKYLHDDKDKRNVPPYERINGHSHLKTLFLPTSEVIPVDEGVLLLGEWQRVFFVECDPGRDRKVLVQVYGE